MHAIAFILHLVDKFIFAFITQTGCHRPITEEIPMIVHDYLFTLDKNQRNQHQSNKINYGFSRQLNTLFDLEINYKVMVYY